MADGIIRKLSSWGSQKPPVGSQINWGHPLSKGLVGCWLMNEGGGLKVKNLYSNNLANLINSPTWNVYRGLGVKFTDSTNYIDCGVNSVLNNLKPVTYFVLFNLTAAQSSARRLLGKSILTNGRGFSSAASSNALVWSIDYDGGATTMYRQTNALLTPGKITQGLVTWDGTNAYAGIHIYIDGKEATYANNVGPGTTLVDDSSAHQYIGNCDSGTLTKPFVGSIYTVCIWNRVLSQSEISSLYTSPYQFIARPRYLFYGTTGGATTTSSDLGMMTCRSHWWGDL
jgi:hypothetical protein